jgi:hypothetical protein
VRSHYDKIGARLARVVENDIRHRLAAAFHERCVDAYSLFPSGLARIVERSLPGRPAYEGVVIAIAARV